MSKSSFDAAVSAFGARAKAKLSNSAAPGAPEDQLRAPLESLARELANLSGVADGAFDMIGESSVSDLKTRPDYAIVVRNALIGFLEIKAPGKGADPRRFSDPHDKEQWKKLKSLPNLIYTDGNAFSLWRDGELQGSIVRLEGDIETSGPALSAPSALLTLFADFLEWNPLPPRTAKQLAEVSARLCRLLRDEVTEQLALGSTALTELAKDWRLLLFPDASDAEFADGYAQAVTFGLLVARARNISLANGIETAAQELRQVNSLIGTALRLLTDDSTNQAALKTSLGTLTRVLDVVHWPKVSKGDPDAWLYFYEEFLAVYDNALRKRTGSYYTPPEVVGSMVRLVDEALQSPTLFGRPLGFAASDVTVADPAVGTGTFLLGVLRRIALTVTDDQGAGAVPAAISAAAKRLIGFELQFGPFAVAQLRLLAELKALMQSAPRSTNRVPELRLFVTDTLGNPFVEEERLPQILQPIGRSRRDANAVKRSEPITVVIGNPPYKEKANGRGGWIEQGSDGRDAPLDRWMPPAEWGVGAHAKHLKNLYVYFWRWATWKVFGSGLKESTGLEETDKAGIICFITVAGFLNGPGFEKMRDDLRRSSNDIWVIDCSPEGHQPDGHTRIFQGVQQPVCIVLAARTPGTNSDTPARVRFYALPEGRREEKFAALAALTLENDGVWADCPNDWRAPFLPAATGAWAAYPALEELFVYSGSGVMPGRTWVIAPDAASLHERWSLLTREKDAVKKEVLFHPHIRRGEPGDKHIRKKVGKGLTGHPMRSVAVIDDESPCIEPTRYAFRSFDRQWIIPDARLINQPNPTLWDTHSSQQVYLTAPHDRSPSAGPALTFASAIPDLHHYHGRGGRVFPLWRDSAAKVSNVKPALLAHLSNVYGHIVRAEDVMAYVAAVLANPDFTARFALDLVRPGLRVPVTADAKLFLEAVELGREVVWLHTFGECFTDAAAGRPARPPRLRKEDAPYIPADGGIPAVPEPLPDEIEYDAGCRQLRVGKGHINNVSAAVWAYEVSGKQVLRQWFSYRRRDRSRPVIGDRRPPSPLDKVQPQGWTAEYTADLLDLLHVLGRLVALEPRQAQLLAKICSHPVLSARQLEEAGALEAPSSSAGVPSRARNQNDLLDLL